MLAEALQTTVLDEVKENVTVLETPKILEEEEKLSAAKIQPWSAEMAVKNLHKERGLKTQMTRLRVT